jgi:hypothetical protein
MSERAAGTPEELWEAMLEASEDLAEELSLGEPPWLRPALEAVDRWVAAHDAALEEDDLGRLGLFLARFLVEAHGGGLAIITEAGHPLDGEWSVSGFRRGLAADYHVPFFVSAVRIGADRSLDAQRWYEQLLAEGARRR